MTKKIKNTLATLFLAASAFYSSNAMSQSDILFKDVAAYKNGLFKTESEAIVSYDKNGNGITDSVLKIESNKNFLGKKILTTYVWNDFDEDGIFDEYITKVQHFNFLSKEKKGNGKPYTSTDKDEINKDYNLPRFNGKSFNWKTAKF